MDKHEEIIRLLAVYDDLSASERTEVDAHVAACADCAAKLAAYQEMDYRLQQLPRLQPESSLRQDFYAKMESNMSNHTRKQQLRRIPAFASQILVVGMLLLLGGVFWVNVRDQEMPAANPVPVTVVSEEANDEPKFSIKDYTLAHKNYQPGDTVSVQVVWEELWPTGNEQVELLLVDKEGEHIAQSYTPLTAGRFSEVEATYELTLPDEIENGRYLVHVEVIDPNREEDPLNTPSTIMVPQIVYVGEESIPTPVRESARIRLESWSPDSQYLVFREYSEAEFLNGDVGKQRIYNLETGEFCPHAIDVRPGNVENWFAWVSDQAFAYLSASGRLVMRLACDVSMTYTSGGERQSILAQSNNLETLLTSSTEGFALENPIRASIVPLQELPEDFVIFNATFSLDDKLLAIVDFEGTIWLLDTETGQVIQTIPWQLEGQLPDPIWLANDQLLARSRWLPQEHALVTLPAHPGPEAQPGPFLVGTDGTITTLASLFGTPINESTQQVIAAPDLEQGSYAIMLYNDPDRGDAAPIRVYHSETGEVETLPYTEIWDQGMTDNGRYLLFTEEFNGFDESGMEISPIQIEYASTHSENFTNYLAYKTSTDSEERKSFQMTTLQNLSVDWAPDYDQIAFKNSELLLQTSSFPDFIVIDFWNQELGYAVVEDVLYSPDGQHLAAVGGMSGVMESGLFVLESDGFKNLE